MPIYDPDFISPFDPRAASIISANALALAYADRQRRFEARCDRRYGDWAVLEYPRPLLWLQPSVCFDEGYVVAPAVIVDLWE